MSTKVGSRRAKAANGDSKASVPSDLEYAIASIQNVDIKTLRRVWAEWFRDPPPRCQSKEVLRRLLAWRAQAERFGGLSREAKRRLKDLIAARDRGSTDVAAPTSILKPGAMLTREWRGVVHRVHVLEDGFALNGKRYSSLSLVARTITGARWSGPRFFGLGRVANTPEPR
nr:DUF2924 domain-containing protein [Nitrosomonas nitrosa]